MTILDDQRKISAQVMLAKADMVAGVPGARERFNYWFGRLAAPRSEKDLPDADIAKAPLK